MNKTLSIVLETIVLVLLQVLLFNNVHLLGGCAYIYVMFLLLCPITLSEKIVMPLCFLIGGIIDIFSGTYGIHTAAFTLVGFIRPWVIKWIFTDNDINGDDCLTYKRQGNKFILYALLIIFIHHLTLLMLEAFEWNLIGIALLKTLVSTLFTSFLILSFCILKNRRRVRN